MSWLIDTNILLRWVHPSWPEHLLTRDAIRALERSGDDLYVTPQNLTEFWNVLTRPLERNGFGLRPAQADAALTEVELRFRMFEDTPEVYRVWRRIVVVAGVSGVQVHDARLVACMRVHGISRILTFNTSDFDRYPDIQPVHPRDVAAP